MSKEPLTQLRDLLFCTLTADNMLWLAGELTGRAKKAKQSPFTFADALPMIKESEKNRNTDEYFTTDEVFSEYQQYLQMETV